jgi:hypothetical protein
MTQVVNKINASWKKRPDLQVVQVILNIAIGGACLTPTSVLGPISEWKSTWTPGRLDGFGQQLPN